MSRFPYLLGQAFPLIALAGLLLAVWCSFNTPDEFKEVQEMNRFATLHASLLLTLNQTAR